MTRLHKSVFWGLLIFSSLFLIGAQLVSAAEYIFETDSHNTFSNVQEIVQPQQLKYLYAQLGKGVDTVDYYQFTIDEFTRGLDISLLVPIKSDFQPSLIITDSRQSQLIGEAPFGLPPTVGGRVFPWPKTTRSLENQQVLEKYLVGPELIRDYSPGIYKLAVFDPHGQGGVYIIRIGAVEKPLSLSERLMMFWAIFRIKLHLF